MSRRPSAHPPARPPACPYASRSGPLLQALAPAGHTAPQERRAELGSSYPLLPGMHLFPHGAAVAHPRSDKVVSAATVAPECGLRCGSGGTGGGGWAGPRAPRGQLCVGANGSTALGSGRPSCAGCFGQARQNGDGMVVCSVRCVGVSHRLGRVCHRGNHKDSLFTVRSKVLSEPGLVQAVNLPRYSIPSASVPWGFLHLCRGCGADFATHRSGPAAGTR